MPLTADSIVHQNTGGVGTSTVGVDIPVSLAGGDTTSAANTVLVLFFGGGTGLAFGTVPGWAAIGSGGTGTRALYRGPEQGLADGESSWNFPPTVTTGHPVAWVVVEMEGVESGLLASVVDVSAQQAVTSGTAIGATCAISSAYDVAVLAIHGAYNSASTTPDTFSAHTDGHVEFATASGVGAVKSVGMSVSIRGNVTSTGLYGSTATSSVARDATNWGGAMVFLLVAAGARRAPNLYYIDGAEHGLVTGNTIGVANYKILETVTAGVTVDAAAARSGNYGWLLASTTAACNFTQGLGGASAPNTQRRAFRFPTLPSGDVGMWVISTVTPTAIMTLRYVSASQKLGMKYSAGSEELSDQTITANQWFAVDLTMDAPGGRVAWQVDYNAELTDTDVSVGQVDAAGSSPGAISVYRVGWTSASTATMHTDDAASAPNFYDYPLGDIRVLPLKVDPAGTPTVVTSANFGVMTANGSTISAWNAVNARNAVDDVPPDLSGTRDAAIVTTLHASETMDFPMETRDLAANKENWRGVKAVACLWAASATAATIRASVNDGVTTRTVFAEADPGADNTATPAWFSRIMRGAIFATRFELSQAKIDALNFRIGSADATPDIGVDMLLLELAVVKAKPEGLFGQMDEPIYVEAHRDPDTFALVGATVTNNSGDPIELAWEVDGVPDSSGSIPDGTTDQYVPLSADGGIETVGTISIIPG